MLDVIAAAVDSATREGRGLLLLGRGPLDDALSDLGHHRADVIAGGFDVAGARGDLVTTEGVHYEEPEALTSALDALLGGGRTVVLVLADVDRALPPIRWHDVFLRHTLPGLVDAQRLVVVASTSSDGVLPRLEATAFTIAGAPVDPDAADAPVRHLFDHLGEETAAKGVDLARRALRVAALEGDVFTVAAVARLLEEDEDDLTDWIDDYLATDDGPLEDIGFAAGLERPLARYRFRERAVLAALQADPPGRRLIRRYGEVLAELYGPAAPEVVFRVWELSGAERAGDYLQVANAGATVRDHVRLLEVERDPSVAMQSLRQVVFAIPSDELLRHARELVARAEPSTELYDLLGVVASREQWLGDAARCEALALELAEEPFPVVQRGIGLSGALLDLARWESGGEPRLGLAVPWLDAIADDRAELIAAAARLLQSAGVTLEQVADADREHWRAHLQHAVAQLEAARGDFDAARTGEEHVLMLLGEPPRESCNLRVLTLLALADACEELGDAGGAREAARRGVEVAVGRSELAEAARGLAKAGRMELALGDAQAATLSLAHSLVIALELELRWAEPGLWTQLGACLEGPAARTCLALGGEGDDERATAVRAASGERAFLKEITGIDRDATEAFLSQLGRTTPPAAPAA